LLIYDLVRSTINNQQFFMPHFVILFHEWPPDSPRSSHFDLMLESDGALRTWAIAGLPCSWRATAGLPSSADATASESVAATQIPDHRLAYLDYEGPVGGDRGQVRRLDAGTFVSIKESSDEWIVEFSGQRIHGRVILQRTQESNSQWQMTVQNSSAISTR
jgi:hypothetical protein